MLNQFIVVFLTLIFYQQRISCDVSFDGAGKTLSPNVDKLSRLDSQNQTVYIRRGWRAAKLESDVFDRSVIARNVNNEKDIKVSHIEPFVNEKAIHIVQNPTPFNVNTPNSLVSQDYIREQIAQTFTNPDAKYSSSTFSNPNKRTKFSAKLGKKSGTASEAHPNLNRAVVSLNENKFKADVGEINRINDRHVPDNLESASSSKYNDERSEPLKEPVHKPIVEPNSVVIKTDFDSIKNTTVLKAIYVPTYKNVTVFSGVTIQPNVEHSLSDEFNTFTNDIDSDDEGIGGVLARSMETFTKNHVVDVDLYKLYEALTGVGKSASKRTGKLGVFCFIQVSLFLIFLYRSVTLSM